MATRTGEGHILGTRVLDANDICRLVHRVGIHRLMDDTIVGLDDAFRTFVPRETVVPIRSGLNYSHPQLGLLEWMPAMRAGQRVTLKVVGYHPHNPSSYGLPTILSTIHMYDVANGHLMAMSDATLLTAMRTGAASAVASRIMANPGASKLGLIGCGAQAVTQLHALSRVFDIRTVFLHDTDTGAMRSFPDRVAILGLEGVEYRVEPPRAFLSDVEILCTATSVGIGEDPVFADQPVHPHLHVNAVGSDFPGKMELPIGLLHRSTVCPDFLDQAHREGECQQLIVDEIGSDIAHVARHSEQFANLQQEVSVFDSTGWAIEDLVTMEILLKYAQELEVGTTLELESVPEDPLDPYGLLKVFQAVVDGAR